MLPTSESLDEHVKEIHAFLCLKCNISFPTMEDCNVHRNSAHTDAISSEHNNDRKIECLLCEISFDNTKKLKEHMETEHSHECTICNQNFKTKSLLKSHMDGEHVMQCNQCDEKMKTIDEMNIHIASTHTFVCISCNHKCSRNELLDQHIIQEHPLMCNFCGIQFENMPELKSHIQINHTYDCEVCDFVGQGEEVMEDHILDLHAQPDSDKVYRCDDCNFNSANKTSFGKHYKSSHGSKSKQKNHSGPAYNNDDDGKQKVEAELRQLRNNFERLEGMYHESLEEVNQVKSEYEAKLIRANDNQTRMMSENEVLKEKIDVLFKLGRSYLNRENRNMEKETVTEANAEEDDEIQVIEENVENVENLQAWTTNKLRGFKRVNPATKAAPKASASVPSAVKPKAPTSPPPASTASTPPPGPTTTPSPPASEAANEHSRKYCHYFVNTGKCNYEERTGLKCKFEHKTAPMCNFGLICTQAKCMFSHPKINGANNNSFLGNMRGMAPMINPWQGQMINPWMTSANQFMPSPWNIQGSQNQRQNQNQNQQ